MSKSSALASKPRGKLSRTARRPEITQGGKAVDQPTDTQAQRLKSLELSFRDLTAGIDSEEISIADAKTRVRALEGELRCLELQLRYSL